jgi:hypothetical protein
VAKGAVATLRVSGSIPFDIFICRNESSRHISAGQENRTL